ncbi:hypothetical protein DFJ77DRAFT_273749 [Powellomyces hirtus]|nr:hypothetical protein DFJ77DRAFT_273749 [Powellomyces hirtus]
MIYLQSSVPRSIPQQAKRAQLLAEHQDISERMTTNALHRSDTDRTLAEMLKTPKAVYGAPLCGANKPSTIHKLWQNVERWIKSHGENMRLVNDVVDGRTNNLRLARSPCPASKGLEVTKGPAALDLVEVTAAWSKSHAQLVWSMTQFLRAFDVVHQSPDDSIVEISDRIKVYEVDTILVSLRRLKAYFAMELKTICRINAQSRTDCAKHYAAAADRKTACSPRHRSLEKRLKDRSTTALLGTPLSQNSRSHSSVATPDAVRAIHQTIHDQVAKSMDSVEIRAASTMASLIRERLSGAAVAGKNAGLSSNKTSRIGVPTASTAAKVRSKSSKPISAAPSPRSRVADSALLLPAGQRRKLPATPVLKQLRPAAGNVLVKSTCSSNAKHLNTTELMSKDNPAAYDRLCEQIVDFVKNDMSSPGVESSAPAMILETRAIPQTSLIPAVPASHQIVNANCDADSHVLSDPVTALGTQAFRPQSEISRTPEKPPAHSADLQVPSLPRTQPPLRINTHKPKTPSKLQNVINFDSSSDSISAQSDFFEGESYQLDPDELDMSPTHLSIVAEDLKASSIQVLNQDSSMGGNSPCTSRPVARSVSWLDKDCESVPWELGNAKFDSNISNVSEAAHDKITGSGLLNGSDLNNELCKSNIHGLRAHKLTCYKQTMRK